ncbi:MAG: glycoside hydrolase family 3 C-terminal domain-containing protein [Lachnospiraceae bacterium]|nr:glycoside hydrolase family 3 C-terminal domain-containing protein [Lachnospiraceae bacterium]
MENNRLTDCNTPIEERLDILLKSLTLEEKIGLFTGWMPAIERLGIKETFLGGEAAHGVQQRNDQAGEKSFPPVTTTVFPQPIGMSMSWDKEMIRAAGEVTGTEARVIAKNHDNRGLSRWAPTVDLERDQRWGRNEEGYGEDPVLTGEMAGSYVLGMQGDDPKAHLRIASVLKHFYANNTEDGRGYKDSVFDDRNKYEYYLETFRRVIKKSHAEGVMAAYNKINGVPGMVNREIQDILKDKYGLIHAVSDGGAPTLLRTEHHYSDDDAVGISDSIKAGIDMMLDNPVMVESAVRSAYEKGMLTEEDIDHALRNSMRTRIRLGIFDDTYNNPYASVEDGDLGSEYSQSVCRELSRESIVLLKNDGSLPIPGDIDVSDILVAGPMSDRWDLDWYSGMPFERSTLKNGIDAVLKQDTDCALCCDRIAISYDKDGSETDLGEYILEDWGENCYSFRDQVTGMYLASPIQGGEVKADHETPFEWFPTTVFGIENLGSDEISLIDWKNRRVMYKDGKLFTHSSDETGPDSVNEGQLMRAKNRRPDDTIYPEACFRLKVLSHAEEELRNAAKNRKYILLALGNQPLVKAREGVDRTTLALPDTQDKLWRTAMELPSVKSGECKVILVMMANYPYAIKEADGKVNAIIVSATGSQYMGRAIADALFGRTAPAGRLVQTWPVSEAELPPIDDYDIIGGGRTYRFMTAEPLYPFGYGLTYTSFKYVKMTAVYNSDEGMLHVHTAVLNTGDVVSDEVVQIYGIAPESEIKKPKCQLIDFARLKGIRPGELREAEFGLEPDMLAIYDVKRKKRVVEAGEYVIFAGRSSADQALKVTLALPEIVYDL